MTARALGLPLVVARRDLRVTEGSSVTVNYVSGSTGHIQTMSLPRRALPQGAKVLVVDDFMKGGGTARGLKELLTEFSAQVLAMGILTATALPAEKLVEDYVALTVLQGVDERRRLVSVVPSRAVADL
jgi:purine operon repressor